MGIKTFTIALSLVTLAGCVGDGADEEDERDADDANEPKVAAIVSAQPAAKNAIGNIR